MTRHAELTVWTGIPAFFCDPHASRPPGTNEHTNGLLRPYFPNGIDLSGYNRDYLDAVAFERNGRPWQALGWLTPTEKFNAILLKAGDTLSFFHLHCWNLITRPMK